MYSPHEGQCAETFPPEQNHEKVPLLNPRDIEHHLDRRHIGSGLASEGGASHVTITSPHSVVHTVRTIIDTDESWKNEFYRMCQFSFPISISTLAHMSRSAMDLAFVGHLGTDQLAAANIAIMMNMSMGVFYMGVAYGMSPLCSQSFGARNYRLVGVWCQMALIGQVILALIFTPLTIILTRPLVQLCNLSDDALNYAMQFNMVCAFAFLPDGVFETLREYLKSQNNVNAATYIVGITTVLNALFNYVFIYGVPNYWGGLGFIGSPLAYLSTSTLNVLFLIGYMAYTNAHKKTWVRWRARNLTKPKRVKEFIQMCVGTFVGIAVDLWVATVVSFMSGALGTKVVSAQGVVYSLWCLIWALFFGVGCAIETRVAQHLGAGNARRAKRATVVGLALSLLIIAVVGLIYYPLSREIEGVYTDEDDVIKEVEEVKILLMACFVTSALGQDMGFVLTACAQPTRTATIATLASLVVQLPLCWVLAFHYDMGLRGLWYACLAGESMRFLAGSAYVARIEWDDEALEAKLRCDLASAPPSGNTTPQRTLLVQDIGEDDEVPDLMLPPAISGTPPHSHRPPIRNSGVDWDYSE